jgi:hypothetical protein
MHYDSNWTYYAIGFHVNALVKKLFNNFDMIRNGTFDRSFNKSCRPRLEKRALRKELP